MLYIAERNVANEHFGKTKLHKQLWMSDFRSFELWGISITGAQYIHRQHGPFCEPLEQSLKRLEDTSKAMIRHRERFGYVQQRVIPLKRSDLTLFTAREIAAVEDVLWETWNLNAAEMSQRSHLHPGWAWTKEGDVIGYEFALVPVDEPLEEPWKARSAAPIDSVTGD